jgi:serine/threonine protein kinase
MGRVYIADETRLRRRCAVKVLLPELAQDKDNVERFLREAQSIAQIHHENVVDIHHLGEDENFGVVFFAMELLSGEDLEMRLADRKKRPIAWLDVCRWMAQVAGAMGAVHAAGLIHRDLKPSNIFLNRRRDGREQVKLLDFGIAKGFNRSALTGTGAALGTPYYMSPEQILAEQLDPRSDIYSLGVLFFEAIAGRMPFIGEPIQVAMQHCNVLPPASHRRHPRPRHPARARGPRHGDAREGPRRAHAVDGRGRAAPPHVPARDRLVDGHRPARAAADPPAEQRRCASTFEPPPRRRPIEMSTAPTGQLPVPRSDARSLEIHFDTSDAAEAETRTNTSPTPVRMPQRRASSSPRPSAPRCSCSSSSSSPSSSGDETPAQPDPIPVAVAAADQAARRHAARHAADQAGRPPPPTAATPTRPATPRTPTPPPTTPPSQPASRPRQDHHADQEAGRPDQARQEREGPGQAAQADRRRLSSQEQRDPAARRSPCATTSAATASSRRPPRRRPTRSASAWPTRSPGPSSRRPAASSSPRRSTL